MGLSAIDELERYADARRTRMGRGELMEPDEGLAQRVVAALQERGIEPVDLDDLVHDAVGADSSRAANNGGLSVQVGFLMKALGAEPLLDALRDQLRASGPSP